MAVDENKILKEIEEAFPLLSSEEVSAALLLVQARADALSMTFEDYLAKYHPEGIAKADEMLPREYRGYVKFIGNDARTIIRAGKSANFTTFVHESAHIFRRQLTGDLKEKAERAFSVTGGKWTEEQEEQFAYGLVEYIRTRQERNEDKREVFEKGSEFVQKVYEGVGNIIELTPEMEEVYEQLFFASGDEHEEVKEPEETAGNEIETEEAEIYFQTNLGQLMFDFTEESIEPKNEKEPKKPQNTFAIDERLKTFAGNRTFGMTREYTLDIGYISEPIYRLKMRDERESLQITEAEYTYLREELDKALKTKSVIEEATEAQKELFRQLLEEDRNNGNKEQPEKAEEGRNAFDETKNQTELPEEKYLKKEEEHKPKELSEKEEVTEEE